MTGRTYQRLLTGALVGAALAAMPLRGTAQSAAPLKTAWGAPNLEGIWENKVVTPFERPAKYGNREFLSVKERADLIQARKYEDASRAFREFLSAFPQSPLADNAQYWLAETHYVRRQFKDALPEFTKVTTQYPQSAKMPDALLKIGYCQIELGDKAAARVSLQQVMKQFPDTTAARLASQRLEQLSQ